MTMAPLYYTHAYLGSGDNNKIDRSAREPVKVFPEGIDFSQPLESKKKEQ